MTGELLARAMPEVPPASHGVALFGSEFGFPPGGFCVSVFLLVRDGPKVLVGRMAESPRWIEEWNPNLAYYDADMRRRALDGLRFPATYLREGEAPDAAATRIWRDQLGLEGRPRLGPPRIVSEAGPSRRSPGHNHWDLVFLFDVGGAAPRRAPAHWATLEMRDAEALRPGEMVMLHGELLPLTP